MVTVRQLKNEVLIRANLVDHGYFCDLSDAHREFWEKLNKIGARNIKTIPPEKCDDIDATVDLDDEEYQALMAEFEPIQRGVGL